MSKLFQHRPIAFNTMAKPIGSNCNLKCTYCYYDEKKNLFTSGDGNRMSDTLLERFIRQYINVQQVDVINFVWQGGEPLLLGLNYFKRIVELQQKHINGKRIENCIQTNGTLLNDDWVRFLKHHQFLVGISIDGAEHVHDHYRLFKDGSGSFVDVMKGIELLQKYQVEFNTLSVVNCYNSQFAEETYQFLTSIGSLYLQFIPVVERQVTTPRPDNLLLTHDGVCDAKVTPWSVLPLDYGAFLISLFNQWVRNDVGRVFVQQFDATLANWVGENPGLCVFMPSCGDSMVVEHNGDVFSCDHFVYPEFKLGNINEATLFSLVQSTQQEQFGMRKFESLPGQCVACNFRFACHGECPKHRFLYDVNGEYGLNYLCEAYKMFFKYVTPYMDFMAQELRADRSPANVMAYAR